MDTITIVNFQSLDDNLRFDRLDSGPVIAGGTCPGWNPASNSEAGGTVRFGRRRHMGEVPMSSLPTIAHA